MKTVTIPLPGTLGTNVGSGADGVLVGSLLSTDPTKFLLESHAAACLAMAEDGNLFTNETTPANEATGDDMTLLPAVPAVNDAYYLGHATKKFGEVRLNITTAGAGTWTLVGEYWNGTAWTAAANVVDASAAFTDGTGWYAITFDIPTDWAKAPVDELVGYWFRLRVATYSAVTTQPLGGRAYVVLPQGQATFTDDTTDFTDADAGDVALLPAFPVLHDAAYVIHSEKFCKVKTVTSQARTGTATITPEYWNGTAWAALTCQDDSAGWSATAGTLLLNFTPPSNWAACTAANGPNGQAGYAIRFRLSAVTDVTQQPLATRGYVLPLVTGADGIRAAATGDGILYTRISGSAMTKSGTTADSKLLLVNVTTGDFRELVWTKATGVFNADFATLFAWRASEKLALVQVAEDGTTELANAQLLLASKAS